MLLFWVILLIEILAGAEVDLFVPSLPELQTVFHLPPYMVQLTLSMNFFAYCLGCLFAGTLGDRYNRRHVILISLFIFVLGSIACVITTHFSILLVGRCLQGIGMSAPAVLAYAIISDYYPIEKQPAMLGILNGMTTTAMAFAPTVGSYINLYFNWKGNFVFLLLFSIFCLIAGFIFIPSKKGDGAVSLSPKAYLPPLYSPILLTYIAAITFLITAYWLFIGISPILFIKDLGVSLTHFGFYQGALAAIFAVVSLLSPQILNKLGQKTCFQAGVVLTMISLVLIVGISLSGTKNPLIITMILMLYSIAVVFPVNILYPLSLEVLPNAKARTAALIMAMRLTLTGIALEFTSYFYNGTFLNIGLAMAFFLMLSLFFIWLLLKKRWVMAETI